MTFPSAHFVPISFGSAKEMNTMSGRNRTENSDESRLRKIKRYAPAYPVQATRAKPGFFPKTSKKDAKSLAGTLKMYRKEPKDNLLKYSQNSRGKEGKVVLAFYRVV